MTQFKRPGTSSVHIDARRFQAAPSRQCSAMHENSRLKSNAMQVHVHGLTMQQQGMEPLRTEKHTAIAICIIR